MLGLPQVRLAVLMTVPEGAGAGALEATRRSLAGHAVLGEAVVTELSPGAETFSQALGRVAAAHPDRDVVCLMAGARLPYAWDARLAKAAHAAPHIAAAVPLCDASSLHSLLPPEGRARNLEQAELIDHSAYCMGSRGFYDTPALHPVCAYLRRDALAAAGPLPGEADPARALNALARRWRALGWVSVLCDYLYVGYEGADLEEAPGVDPVEASAFRMHSPLASLQRAVGEAIERGLPPVSTPALDAKPVQLHVMHFWGGGLDKWVRDFCRADGSRTNLMLATYRIGAAGGQRVVLYSDPDAKVPVRTWDIARPIRATVVASPEYRAILEQVIREFQVEAILVSSLIGHSLDALRQPVQTLVVAHDFYPHCQAINPRFDEVCPGCDAAHLEACGKANPHFEVLGSPTPPEWQALRDAYVALLKERGIEMAVPDPTVAQMLERIEPRLAGHPVRVIPHGIDFPAGHLAHPPLADGERLRLVVLGRMAENKGEELLKRAASDLAPLAEVTLVGCGPHAMKLAPALGWKAIEGYTLEELPGILAGIRPHAAVLASIVPETFSYTLSELWTLGIPPLATALGSFASRIRDGVDGFLFEPREQALLDLIRGLRAGRGRLAAVAAEIRRLPPQRATAEMVRDYHGVLPLGPRPVARFEVGIGTETALTEPYRQLQKAYAHLQEAYGRVHAAYGSTAEAYEHARREFERVDAELVSLRAMCQEYGEQLELLNVGRRWWRAPEAERLVLEMRAKTRTPATAAAQDTKKIET